MISTKFMINNKIDIFRIIEFIETDLNAIEHAIIGGVPKNHEIHERETILLCILDILEKIKEENENKISESKNKHFWVCYFCKKNIYELSHVCDRIQYKNERRTCSFCGFLFLDNKPHWCEISSE